MKKAENLYKFNFKKMTMGKKPGPALYSVLPFSGLYVSGINRETGFYGCSVFTALLFVVYLLYPLSGCLAEVINEETSVFETYLMNAVQKDEGLYVSLNQYCAEKGVDYNWDRTGERFTLNLDEGVLVFVLDNHFYSVNGSLRQLVFSPFMQDGKFYIRYGALKSIVETVSEATPGNASAENKTTSEALEGKDVKSVVNEQKTNKALYEIAGDNDWTIVIDPGHGGKDPGAIGQNGTYEKDVVLSISLKLAKLLKNKSDLNVKMTRTTDVFIPLKQRTEFANREKADLFVSIHANAIGGNKRNKSRVKGYKVYFLSEAKNEADKLVAMRENSVIELEDEFDKGDYLQNVLIDMAGNEYLVESQDFAITISETIPGKTDKVGRLHKGVGQAPFYVLNGAFMPCVLVETGFISNVDEEKLLNREDFQQDLAEAIFLSIEKFVKRYEDDI